MTLVYWFVEYAACFIEIFGLFCFCDLFVPLNSNKLVRCFFITTLSAFNIFLNNIKLISIVSTAIMIFLYWCTQFYVRKKKPLTLIVAVFFYMSIIISIDFILYSALNLIIGIDFSEFSNTFSLYRLGVILGAKTILIISCIFMHRISDKKQLEGKKLNLIVSLSSVVMIIISTIMYFVQLRQDKHFSQSFILMFFVIMLLMIISIYCSLVFIVKKEHFKQDYLLIEQQNILLQKSLEEQEKNFDLWRKSLHDYKHKLLALESMMKANKYDDAFESIENELKVFKNKVFYIHTGNNTIDIVLNSKMNVAQYHKITCTINAKITEKIDISDMDLSVILGNLIDNAIEAALKEKNKNIHIQISQIKEVLVIKIINSYSGERIIFETAKDNSLLHGIGLKSVKHLVNKYNGLFSIELENNCVIALVTIEY